MRRIRPMLATLVPRPFHRPGWIYEEKYDGIRAIAHRHGSRTWLDSRNLNDITAQFPEIAGALRGLPGGDFTLDGEIVALDRRGVSRFQLLQRRARGAPVRTAFAVFDCLERDGAVLLERPLSERRRALEQVVARAGGPLSLARRLSSDGLAAYRVAVRRGWEGILAKDEASPYEPGRRSRRWLKVKCRKEAEFVIGGFTPPRGQRRHLGALLVGLFDGPALRYTGKVGAGFSGETLADLAERMRPLVTNRPPFQPVPPIPGAAWIRPELVAQVAFTEWTAGERLRHPTFLGLRDDKKPSECTWAARER